MKAESIFQARKASGHGPTSGGHYFVLVDAQERSGEGLASQEEVELLVREAVAEGLGDGPLDEAKVKAAIEGANSRLRLACEGESNSPIVSIAVVAQLEEGFLLAGVGDCRIYGVSDEKTELAFCDPSGAPAKGSKKRSTSRKNRLGSDANITLHTQRISESTYQALLALSFETYSAIDDKQWRELGDTPALAKTIREAGGNKAWILRTGEAPVPVKRGGSGKRRLAVSVAVAAVAVMALVGSGIFSPREATVEEETVVVDLPPPTPVEVDYEQQMSELASLFEAEIEAQNSLLQEHKSEMATLWDDAEQQQKLQEDLLQLSDLLAVETRRIADLETGMLAQQDELRLTKASLNEREETIAFLETSLEEARLATENKLRDEAELLAKIEMLESHQSQQESFIGSQEETLLDLQQSLAASQAAFDQHEELVAELQAERERNEIYAAALEDDHAALLSQFAALSESTADVQLAIATEQEKQEALKEEMNLLEASLSTSQETIAASEATRLGLEATIAQLQEREQQQQALVEEVLTARVELSEQLTQLTDRNEGLRLEKAELLSKVADLEEVQHEFERERHLRSERDEMLAKLSGQMEAWKEAMLSLESSRAELHQELSELRAYQKQVMQGREAVAKTDVSSLRAGATHVTRVHLVSPGESLESIAQRYYGSRDKAGLIVEANSETVSEGHDVRVGTALVIP